MFIQVFVFAFSLCCAPLCALFFRRWQRWSRPILEIQTDYTQLEDIEREKMHEMRARKQALARAEAAKAAAADPAAVNKSRLPTRATYDYAIRPESGAAAHGIVMYCVQRVC